MNKEHSLEEDVRHGTKEQPMTVMRFAAGPKTYYPDGFFVQRHWHSGIEMIKIKKGSYTVEVNLEKFTMREGDFCIFNSEELHQIRGNEAVTLHDVIIFQPQILAFSYEDEVQRELIGPLMSHKDSLVHVMHPGDRGYMEFAVGYERIVACGLIQEDGWYYEAKIGVLGLLNQLKKNQMIHPFESMQSAAEKEKIDRYKRVVSYIEEHYKEKVSLEELAGAAQCNAQYLCHVFKEIAGVPPVRYLINYRVERAKELLQKSTQTVLEISLNCGFENVSYFIRQFKRGTGMTPREYRGK